MSRHKKPEHCKGCKMYWPHGVKDGKHDRWCCKIGQPAPKVVSHSILHKMKETAPTGEKE